MDKRKKDLLRSRLGKENREKPLDTKTQYEKQQTREEVEQIKKELQEFAESSWGNLWIQSNLKHGRPFRMQRGIEYAKDYYRIDNISINPGQIFATVQGTAPTPYRVKINFEIIPEEGWEKILKSFQRRPLNLIELLEGNLPHETISLFEENGYSLFPPLEKRIDATCSCPDKEIPCKHIAALILYLARILDYNPFLLLELRGKSKTELFNELNLGKESESGSKPITPKRDVTSEFSFNIPQINIQSLSKKEKLTTYQEENLHFNIKKPRKYIETIENLGSLPNIESKTFEIVLKAIYNKTAETSYKMSLD